MIHQTAAIDPKAELGTHVTVSPFAYIESGVRIGDGCVIGPHVAILRYTTLGANCRVHAGAVLGDVPTNDRCRCAEDRAAGRASGTPRVDGERRGLLQRIFG